LALLAWRGVLKVDCQDVKKKKKSAEVGLPGLARAPMVAEAMRAKAVKEARIVVDGYVCDSVGSKLCLLNEFGEFCHLLYFSTSPKSDL
jgi:hypothetical protein